MLPIGIAAGLIGEATDLINAHKQKKLARKAAAQADALNAQALGNANNILSQAKSSQSEARNLYDARMANAGAIEKDIYGNQANTLASMGRNATDASQMLGLSGAVQGNSNQAFNQLAQTEAEDKQRRYYNVQAADQGVQGAYGNLQNYYGGQAAQAQQSANQLMQAGMANQQNAINGIANVGMMAGMGQFGDLSSLFGGTNTRAPFTSSVNAPNQLQIGGTNFSSGYNIPPPSVNLSLPYPSMQQNPYRSPLQYNNPYLNH